MATTPGTYGATTTGGDELGGLGASAMTPELDAGAGGNTTAGTGASVVGATGGSIKEQIRSQAETLKSQATERATDMAEQGRAKAVGALGGVATAAHEIADKLKGTDAGPLAGYADKAAAQVEAFAASLRDRPLDQLVADARGFVLRNPSVAIGVAAFAGFAVARFLKASSQDDIGAYQRSAPRSTSSYGSASLYAGDTSDYTGDADGYVAPLSPYNSATTGAVTGDDSLSASRI